MGDAVEKQSAFVGLFQEIQAPEEGSLTRAATAQDSNYVSLFQ